MLEKLKSIPIPIWVGLGLVLLLVIFMGGKSSSGGSGTITGNTVGSAGGQTNAGTDQELGNLSVVTQSGFNQILQNEQSLMDGQATLQSGLQTGFGQIADLENTNAQTLQTNGETLQGISTGMGGFSSSMQGFGAAIQSLQNAFAQFSASHPVNTQAGATVNNAPSSNGGGGTVHHVGQYTVALPGGGDVTVNASSAAAAIQNAAEQTGFDTSHSSVSTVHAAT